MKSEGTGSIGVLLLNLGGPDSLSAVKPFLFNLFSDREIIRLGPSFMQKPLAYLISSLRAKKTADAYRLIGGKSPILDLTVAQAKALEEELNKLGVRSEESGVNGSSSIVSSPSHLTPYALHSFKVYVAMRYWHPLIEDTIEQMHIDGIDKILVLSLYPHYSIATTGSSIKKFEEVVTKIYQISGRKYAVGTSNYKKQLEDSSFAAYSLLPTAYCVTSWFNNPLYIDALVDVIRKGIDSFKISSVPHDPSSMQNIHVLFSAHSLPVKFIEEGDPYVEHIKGTINEITKKINITWDLSYQSKSGPVEWLEPSTDKKLEELAGKGMKNLLVVPISFVSDHIETLYEIDILYKNVADALGIRLERVESLNTSPLLISALKDIVFKSIKEARWEI